NKRGSEPNKTGLSFLSAYIRVHLRLISPALPSLTVGLLTHKSKLKLRAQTYTAITLRGAGAKRELADARKRVRSSEQWRTQIANRCSLVSVIQKIRDEQTDRQLVRPVFRSACWRCGRRPASSRRWCCLAG